MTPAPVLKKKWSGLVLIAFAAVATACVSPPVQEMSNARQAIAAAQEAGGEAVAEDELERAHKWLQTAEQRLQKKKFREARRAAVEAKLQALEALQKANQANAGQ